MPTAPVWVTPQSFAFNRAAALVITWQLDASEATNNVQFTEVQWAPGGVPGPTWTTPAGWSGNATQIVYTAGSPGYIQASVTLPAGTITSDQPVQFRVRWQSFDFGNPFSAYSYLSATAVSVPAAPTITAPAAAATVSKTATVTWTATGQQLYEIEVRTATGGGGTVVYSGSGTTATSHVVTMDLSGQSRFIRVRYAKQTQPVGVTPVWSAYTQVQVSTLFLNPATPTLSVALADPTSIGVSHVVVLTITDPAPGGGQPTVTTHRIEYRRQGSSDPWVVLDANAGLPPGPFRFRAPHGSWEFRVVAIAGSTGTEATSATASITVTLRGLVIDLPASQAGVMWVPYNEAGQTEDVDVESALIQYAGRAYPALEFGDGLTRQVSADTVHLRTRLVLDQLLAFMYAKDVVRLRDAKGRKVYGLLKIGGVKDTFYGFTASLSVTQTDYTADEITAD